MSTYELAISRRSIRRFKQIAVPYEILEKCVDAARLAPSAANLQPLEFIIVDDEQLLDKVFRTLLTWAASLGSQGIPPVGSRPKAYIAILRNKNLGITFSVYDVGLAVENMVLVALEEGIGSCCLGSADQDRLAAVLNIPDDYEIALVLALGYPDESPVEEPFDSSTKYWKDDNGVLHVPKKSLKKVLHRNAF
ncbi:MAG: nitroreductase family protein [Dehalococcoidia bacterium]|nr:nitroreductase family protein [Dehalococcoidia bacterium]